MLLAVWRPADSRPAIRDMEAILAARRDHFEYTSTGVVARLQTAQAEGAAEAIFPIPLGSAIATRATAGVLQEIALRPEVRLIVPDDEVELIPTEYQEEAPPVGPSPGPVPLWNIKDVRAELVWERLGIDGSGGDHRCGRLRRRLPSPTSPDPISRLSREWLSRERREFLVSDGRRPPVRHRHPLSN